MDFEQAKFQKITNYKKTVVIFTKKTCKSFKLHIILRVKYMC